MLILILSQLRHNFADAWSNLGSAYMCKGRFNEGSQCNRQALNPRWATSWVLHVEDDLRFEHTVAYDTFDPYGSINIKWDIVSWTPDGYVAVVTIQNSQIYRPIMSPGWTIGWTWAKKEVIWSMVGAQATDQGDCSKFKGNIPRCCMRNPTIADLLPGVPNNQRFFDCCKGGVLASSEQDPSAAVSAFQLSVGLSGTSNKTVKPPKNFYLLGPGPGYTCGASTVAPPTVSLSADCR